MAGIIALATIYIYVMFTHANHRCDNCKHYKAFKTKNNLGRCRKEIWRICFSDDSCTLWKRKPIKYLEEE